MDGPELSDVIAKLRASLIEAQRAGQGQALRFLIEDIEVELQFAVTKEGTGSAGVKFWVIEAKADGKYSNAVTQKIKMKLKIAGKDEPEDRKISTEGAR